MQKLKWCFRRALVFNHYQHNIFVIKKITRWISSKWQLILSPTLFSVRLSIYLFNVLFVGYKERYNKHRQQLAWKSRPKSNQIQIVLSRKLDFQGRQQWQQPFACMLVAKANLQQLSLLRQFSTIMWLQTSKHVQNLFKLKVVYRLLMFCNW